MKVLFDTCVVIDILQERVPFFEESSKALETCLTNNVSVYITSNTFTDIHYILHKAFHNELDTRERMTLLIDVFDILSVESDTCIKSLYSKINDLEDALLVEVALSNNVDYICTRNIKDFKQSLVRAVTPEELQTIL